jgi:hypothetical protein
MISRLFVGRIILTDAPEDTLAVCGAVVYLQPDKPETMAGYS